MACTSTRYDWGKERPAAAGKPIQDGLNPRKGTKRRRKAESLDCSDEHCPEKVVYPAKVFFEIPLKTGF